MAKISADEYFLCVGYKIRYKVLHILVCQVVYLFFILGSSVSLYCANNANKVKLAIFLY